MTIYIIRASHANQFELQNYEPLKKKLNIKVVTSHQPLTHVNLPTISLWSPTDLPNFSLRRQLLNRLIGGEQWLVGLEKIIKPGSIIHTAETYTPYTHQAVELKKKGVINKLVCTCWETIPHNNEKFTRLRKWKREAYVYVDIFHTPTELAKKALMEEGVDPHKIMVVPYGIDTKRFHPVKRKPNKRPLVLTVARLTKEKGMHIIERVAQSLPQYDFVVVGQGNYIPQGSNLKVKTVSYEHIHKEYQKADLFLLPSQSSSTWEEQYGMAVVEAMNCGLPIVVSNSGALPEVVGENGIVIPQKDVAEYVKAIKGTLCNRSNPPAKYNRNYIYNKLSKLYLITDFSGSN